jgi:hypothetical protein
VAEEGLANWPEFTAETQSMVNLNETGGEEISTPVIDFIGHLINGTEYVGPGFKIAFSVVDAGSWEGGRGARCEFWRSLGEIVPE